MNARERLRLMIRDTPGSMTVWSKPEIDNAFARYDAEHRVDVIAEAAALLRGQAARKKAVRHWSATGLRLAAHLLDKLALGDEAFTILCSASTCQETAPLSVAVEDWQRPVGGQGWLCLPCGIDAEKATAPAAPATQEDTDRQAALLNAIRKEPARRWKSGRALALLSRLGYHPISASTASHDLAALAAAGHLTRREQLGVRWYEVARRTGGAK